MNGLAMNGMVRGARRKPQARTSLATMRASGRRGMTLLELMLALTLTAMVLVTISMAIDLHLRALQGRRAYVERIQLARAVLNVIAADLRATIQQNTTDFSSLASMAAMPVESGAAADALAGTGTDTGTSTSGGTGGTGSTGTGTGGTGTGRAGSATDGTDTDSSETSQTEDIASASTLPPVPGLYGNQYELQVDVSRLLRVDEMQRMTADTRLAGLQDIPSDVKTVAYYCVSAESAGSGGVMNRRTGRYESGLVRRVMDRAVTLYATENGNLQGLQQAAEVIAPEVASIEFQYFDGSQWVYEWDSCEQQGLPIALKITLLLNPDEVADADTGVMGRTYSSTQIQPEQVYSLTIRLPTAKPVTSDASADSSGMEAVGL